MSRPSFASRTVLVTGASRGLGLSIAEAFWERGADLFLVARCEDALAAIASRLLQQCPTQRIGFLSVDLSNKGAAERIFAQLRDFTDRLDVVVNNAAILGPIGPFSTNDWAAWENTLQVNFLAPAAICQVTVSWMQAGGVILNISGGGATAPRPFFSAYSAAKAALVRLSETLASEVKPLGIRVNCIAPGAMNTQMNTAVLLAGPDLVGEIEHRKAIEHGKVVTPPEVPAELAVYLASDECSAVTGRLISAEWDPWRNLHSRGQELEESDIYTLRRIVPEDRGFEWGGEAPQ